MAAASLVRIYEVKPGRQQEFMAALAEQQKVVQSTGGKTRTWRSALAGLGAGRVITVAEYENNAALGAGLDQLLAQGPLPIQKVLEGDNPAAESVSLSSMVEIT